MPQPKKNSFHAKKQYRSRPHREARSNPSPYSTANMVSMRDALQSWRAAMDRGGREARLVQLDQLWRNWDMVMGKFLAPVAHPLGHREGILIIGAEDHFLMQELSMATPELLERANAFMGEDVFLKVDLQLLMGRVPLNRIRTADYPALPPPPRPEPLGGLMGLLSPSSPVARSYEAYVNLFEQLKKEAGES